MANALIGYTGFVGSNLSQQVKFDELFNSSNINDIRGKSFDLVVCAGVPALKWWANLNPEKDLAIIKSLIELYKSIKAHRFVLISTIDVYSQTLNVTEEANINIESVCPYGKHRLYLERELEGSFDNYHILRLPGLFGKGLKKNMLFDLISLNILEKINLESKYQWYPLSRIWKDIQLMVESDIDLLNLAVEPIKSKQIKESFFNSLDVGSDPFPLVYYDIKSIYTKQFNSNSSEYILTADQIFDELEVWLRNPGVVNG